MYYSGRHAFFFQVVIVYLNKHLNRVKSDLLGTHLMYKTFHQALERSINMNTCHCEAQLSLMNVYYSSVNRASVIAINRTAGYICLKCMCACVYISKCPLACPVVVYCGARACV